MKNLLILVVVSLIAFPCFAKETINCKNIDQYLPDCMKMKCETVTNTGEKITQEILGLDKNKKCIHKQYQPNGNILDCSYSEESRKFLALQIKNSKFEPDRKIYEEIEKKMQPVYEPTLVEEIFSNECKIIEKDHEKNK